MTNNPHPEAKGFRLANFRDVDSTDDSASFINFLDRFYADFNEMIKIGVDLLRLRPGSSVLDVGCGHGTIIPMLAATVGPTGHVTGIDLSKELIAEAHSRLDASGLPVTISIGNAQKLDFGDATFNAVRTDRVLAFVPDPRAAVLEIARVTKAGGRVVITEVDLGASMLDSSDVDTTLAVLRKVIDEFPNGWIGRKLRGIFLEAGLVEVEVRFFTLSTASFAEWSRRFAIEDSVAEVVRSNRISAARAKRWLDELRERDAEGRFLASSTMCMVSGTKPMPRLDNA